MSVQSPESGVTGDVLQVLVKLERESDYSDTVNAPFLPF